VLQCEDWAVGNVSEFLPHLFSGDTHLTSVSAFDYQYETALEQLAMQCINNGIIYLDEIDKIRKSSGSGKDVGGEAVQNELLKVLENGMIHLWQNKRGNSKQSRMKICTVDTKNIVFVCGGAFEGLQEIVDRRLKKSSNIGFTSQQINVTTETTLLSLCTTEDLIEYGFKREFLGRLPLRTHLDKLTKHDLERIIVEPKDNLYSQYKLLFKLFDIDLKIDKKAIGFLAEKALETNTGARALKSIFTSLFTDSLYNLYHTDGTEIKVGLDFCKERL
jgi:ATP-dependent Clp protease ATP-binding subunit ClpX